jgi:hypothetical protein
MLENKDDEEAGCRFAIRANAGWIRRTWEGVKRDRRCPQAAGGQCYAEEERSKGGLQKKDCQGKRKQRERKEVVVMTV